MDPSLEEAAEVAGASPFAMLFTVTFPLIMPAIISGMLLSFIVMLGIHGIPAVLGAPSNINVLTTYIFKLTNWSPPRRADWGRELAIAWCGAGRPRPHQINKGRIGYAEKNTGAIAAVAGLALASPAVAQQELGSPDLIAAAKKEGKLIYYTANFAEVEQQVIKEFNKRFPEIKIEMVRAPRSAHYPA